MTATVETLLSDALFGRAEAVVSLMEVPHARLLRAGEGSKMVVRREAVAQVLRDLGRHVIDGTTAQHWASLIRRGYLNGDSSMGGIKPLDIEYEGAYEDAIVEAVARLDQIGDSVEGDIPEEAEIRLLLYALGFIE
jgi:hypothetical protein